MYLVTHIFMFGFKIEKLILLIHVVVYSFTNRLTDELTDRQTERSFADV